MEKYRFNEKRHLHELFVDGQWKPLTGITTILSIVAKPALIQWSANQTVEYIKNNFKGELTEELLKEAKYFHRKKKEKAGDWGTEIHALIEKYIKTGEENEKIKNFIDWVKNNKVKFLESERNIYSEKHFLGGIVDFVCEINGEIWIGDIKTSKSGLYAENMWQMAGYEIILNECSEYKDIKGYVLLNLKENGEFQEKRTTSNQEHQKAFLACLEIYRQKEKTNNQIL